MIAVLNPWWQGRTLREQRLLALLGGLALLVLGWLLILRPLGDALADARERHGRAVLLLAETRSKAGDVERLRKHAASVPASSAHALVGDSARAAGFPVTRLEEAGGGSVRLVIEAVRPQAFFGWVGQMEAQGLVVAELQARPNTDRTLAAQVVFRPRRA